MARALVAAVLVAAAAHAALAAPPSIKLTPRQVAAAAKAARAKIKINKENAKHCFHISAVPDEEGTPRPPSSPLLVNAWCFRRESDFDHAISYWKRVLAAKQPEPKDVEDVMHDLGPAYEAIGRYAEAAQAYQDFAKAYPKGADARDQLVRAICTWEQLGRADYATHNRELLTRVWPKPAVDADHLCDAVRPIQPPAP
jgi:tetratricopeptide (TPR) repeat protein